MTEYELGPQGFGTPDGSVHITTPDRHFFVFVEAKCDSFAMSCRQPPLKTVDDLSAPDLDIDRLCRENTFNSSLNGQLELRWRFVNAFRMAYQGNHALVTEQRVSLNQELLAADRFYWRLLLAPNPAITGHWRRVDMSGDLACHYQLLSHVDEFLLLAITCDEVVPDFARTLRLFDQQGNRLDVERRVFWLPRRLIDEQLTTI